MIIFRMAALVGLFLLGCTNNTDTRTTHTTAPQPLQKPLPDFMDTDSLELLYYPDPSVQRSYKRLVVTDAVLVRQLSRELQRDTATFSECPHPVKFYLFRNGDVYKTIYANTADGCRYFAYAIGARPVYVPMQDRAAILIDSLAGKAK